MYASVGGRAGGSPTAAAARGVAPPPPHTSHALRAQIKNLVVSGANMLASREHPDTFAPVARAVFSALAQSVKAAGAGSSSRRRLLATLDLSDPTAIQSMLASAAAIAAGNGIANVNAVSADILTAVSNALASLNTIIASATSVETVQKAIVVAETTLSTNIDALVTGTITPTQFQAATSINQLTQDVQQAEVRRGGGGQWRGWVCCARVLAPPSPGASCLRDSGAGLPPHTPATPPPQHTHARAAPRPAGHQCHATHQRLADAGPGAGAGHPPAGRCLRRGVVVQAAPARCIWLAPERAHGGGLSRGAEGARAQLQPRARARGRECERGRAGRSSERPARRGGGWSSRAPARAACMPAAVITRVRRRRLCSRLDVLPSLTSNVALPLFPPLALLQFSCPPPPTPHLRTHMASR